MKIIYYMFYGFFIVLLLAVAGLFLMPLLPLENNIQIKIVESGSMEPSISTGSLVVVRPQASYGVGDVVTFESTSADIPTTHRILEVREENGETFFMTKGDANEEADTNEANAHSVIGKVVLDVPYAGFILDFARQPIGFAFLIVLPALMIVFGEIEKIWKEARKRKEKVVASTPDTVEERSANSGRNGTAPVVRMMEIAVPVYMPGVQAPAEIVAREVTAPRTSLLKEYALPFVIVLASLVFVGMSFIGGTVSYFNDIEASLSNVLKASLLDFTAEIEGPEYAFEEDDSAVVIETTIAPKNGSMDAEYEVEVEYVSGSLAFCDAIVADAGDPILYSGPLLEMVAGGAVFAPVWNLGLSLNPLITDYLPLDTCVADIVFTAWYADGNEGDGYSDIEKVRLTLTAPGVPLLRTFNLIEPFVIEGEIVEELPALDEEEPDVLPTDPTEPEEALPEPIVEEEPEVIPEPEEPEPQPEVVEEPPIE